MSSDTLKDLEQTLLTMQEPYSGEPLGDIANVVLGGDTHQAMIQVQLPFPLAEGRNALSDALRAKAAEAGIDQLKIQNQSRVKAHRVQKNLTPVASVKNTIAIASGKGGVGKSTVTTNLAAALHLDGASVGILDADIYGPSQPRMLGVSGKPEILNQKKFVPLSAHGMAVMSIGFLVEEDTPMIWRGPMVSQALQQLLNDAQWPELDYLLIDMPPGTGDIQLTLAQKIPVTGAVTVTTPQDIALLDARRAVAMFEKVGIANLGLIENMSMHICPECGHESAIFGQQGGEKMADACNMPMLGRLPLDIAIREGADSGSPIVVSQPESDVAMAYREAARKMAARVALRPRNLSMQISDIQLESV